MQKLFEIVQIMLDATTQRNRWFDLSDALVEYFEMRSALIFRAPMPRDEIPFAYYSAELRRPSSKRVVEFFEKGSDESEHVYVREFMKIPAFKLTTEEAAMHVGSWKQLPFSTERQLLQKLCGVQSRLPAVLNDTGPWRDVVSLHSAQHSKDVPKRVFKEMDMLLPLIGKAMNTSRAFLKLEETYGAKLSALNHISFGAALINDDGVVVYANDYLKDILLAKDGISISTDRRLRFSFDEMARSFELALQSACAPFSHLGIDHSSRISVKRDSLNEPYFMKVNSIHDTDREADIRDAFALVFVIDPTRPGSLSDSGIVDLDLLTEAERNVCRLLLNGASTNEIALMRNVSINTVRQQIKSILQKLRCRDRLHLYQVAFTTHLPLRNQSAKC